MCVLAPSWSRKDASTWIAKPKKAWSVTADAPGAIAAARKPMRMAAITSNAIEPQYEARAVKDKRFVHLTFPDGLIWNLQGTFKIPLHSSSG